MTHASTLQFQEGHPAKQKASANQHIQHIKVGTEQRVTTQTTERIFHMLVAWVYILRG